MDIFERAASAWKIQSEEERVAQAEQDRKLREEFSELLQKITGTTDFTVRGSGRRMSAEIEGVVFIPDMRFYYMVGGILGVMIVAKRSDGTLRTSGLIRKTGDLGRELERLKNDQSVPPKRANDRHENETQNSVAQAV